MIADRLRWTTTDGRCRLTARVRAADGTTAEAWIEVPEIAAPAEDASPLVPALLPWAMLDGEPLEVDGPVSPRLLETVEAAVRGLHSLEPALLAPVEVRAAEAAEPPPPSETTASFFSRGVDSWYSALTAREERDEPPLAHLVYLSRLDLMYDDERRARACALTREAAPSAGAELLEADTNLRDLMEPRLEWRWYHGPALAAVALALRPRRMLIPSTFYAGELERTGSHPDLDHRWSTAATRIVHHGAATRVQKVALLAGFPEGLPRIKTCYRGNLDGNCGDCSKCTHTMLELHLAGVDPRTAGFDRPLVPSRAASLLPAVQASGTWREVAVALRRRPEDAALAEAAELTYLRAQADGFLQILEAARPVPGREEALAAARAARDAVDRAAEVYRPGPHVDGVVGLVRGVDRVARRHVYGIGRLPPSEPARELGGLHAFRQEAGSLGVWLTGDGRLATERDAPGTAPRSARAILRWVLGPLVWRGPWSPAIRARAVLRRAQQAARPPGRPAEVAARAPVAYLLEKDGPGRVALLAAVHPVTGDQLLTTDPAEPRALGYAAPRRLGHLVTGAPVTGGRPPAPPPTVPWARRFGAQTS